MAEPIEISSDDIMESFDCHFRVFAGPGAGKTHWLINHIRNVAGKSKALSPTRKIVCITYTNVAANEIKDRLGDYVDKVDVSTIHSFLYRYVVKPYLHIFVDENGDSLVKHARVDGHDVHRQSYTVVSEWIKELKGTWIIGQKSKLKSLKNNLNRISWELEKGILNATLTPKKNLDYITKPFKDNLELYKKMYWKQGVIDHEDVLYFAYRILDENPELRFFLALKFPYVYVDEFQDTNPIQAQIIRWLGESDSYIGIIGDLEQSIYSFQGANPEYFRNFSLPAIQDYKILGNRRSTVKIVDVLNNMRSDELKQSSITDHEDKEGLPVEIHVGDFALTLTNINEAIGDKENLAILARRNDEVNSIRRKQNGASANDIWQDFIDADSDRARFIETIIITVELFRKNQHAESLKKLCKLFEIKRNGNYQKPLKCCVKISKIKSRGIALSVINKIANKYDSLQKRNLLHFYNYISKVLCRNFSNFTLARITSRGKIGAFAEIAKLSDLTNSVSLSGNEIRNIRTIHQSKGAQFHNVLVSLGHMDSSQALSQLGLIFDGCASEDKRILYVAMSRARKRLFVVTPEMSQKSRDLASRNGYKVVVH